MSARVLILTAGFGEGHNAAARALATAFDTAAGPGTAELADVFALARPRLNAGSRALYLGMINRTPRLWSAIYAWLDRSPAAARGFALLGRERRVLKALLARREPDAICSTYPVYAFLLAELARASGRVAPHFNVVTDSISINSLWWRAGCEGWFLPNADSADVLARAGVGAGRRHVTGFPVAPFFTENQGRLRPPPLASGAAPRVLYIVNSGTRDADEMARRLLAEHAWEVTCAVGRDEALRRRLVRLAAARGRPATILGWTDQVPRLLMTHHVVISKAGGATTQEAIAARCPMIVNQIVPGQEEGNYELLRRHGAGVLAETPEAVIESLRSAFASSGAGWRRWRIAMEKLAPPDAAADIVRIVLAHADTRREPVPLPLCRGSLNGLLVGKASA